MTDSNRSEKEYTFDDGKEDDVIRVTAYHNENFDLSTIWFDSREHDSVRASLSQPFQARTESRSLRVLDILPLEILHQIHEHGRVIGLLLEKVEGREAGIEDLEQCTSMLKRLHELGLRHGDANRYNFVVGKSDIKVIDFENSQLDQDESLMRAELEGLAAQLKEETGRGGGFRPMESENSD
ncbi:MAG: hypothetical protein M4579_000883 [Chaenotheca gracillima]|nr:MAG: hypothetical protein M4579_000883 [Chaenotheca gracillima]